MEKKELKRKNSIGYMVLSLVIAVVIWILAAYLNDNSTQIKIKNIDVNYIGRSQLAENGLVIVNDNAPVSGYSVIATGKRDVLARSFGKWAAEVDVSGIKSPGEYDLEGKVTPPGPNLTVMEKNFNTIHVKIEELVSKEIPIEVRIDELHGKLVKTETDHRTAVVSGAKNEVEKVSVAVALLGPTGIDITEQSVTLPLMPADSKREPVPPPNDTLSLDIDRVTVICTAYDLVTLPVRLELTEQNTDNDIDYAKTRISPASATVGVLSGSEIQSVRAEVKSISTDEMECELIEEEGMYIPESSRLVRVKLVMKENE